MKADFQKGQRKRNAEDSGAQKRPARCPAEGARPELRAQLGAGTHLVDAALNYGEESESYCVEAEENIIDSHRVHPAGITD